MLLDTLHKQRAEIIAAGRQYGARYIRVFGSVARGEECPDSDIDFLVDLPPGYVVYVVSERKPFSLKNG
jgi:predicted nucleotidyltransferase